MRKLLFTKYLENIDMKQAYKTLRGTIYEYPLAFSMFKNIGGLTKIANTFLPYSIGIEIECKLVQPRIYNNKMGEIKNLLSYDFDGSEIKFRIPSGIEGMVCLYEALEVIKTTCELNEGSGIHYHVDCTDIEDVYWTRLQTVNKPMVDWMLLALDSWNYKGTFNARAVTWDNKHAWVNFREHFKTIEFRIGEMSFDYMLIIKRIIHLCNIVRKYKSNFKKLKPTPSHPFIKQSRATKAKHRKAQERNRKTLIKLKKTRRIHIPW